MVGQPMRAVGGGADTTGARIRALVDTNHAAIDVARLVPAFFALVVATQFALYVLAGVALSRRSVGERWRSLLEAGVDQVTLLEDGTVVYGPMSLHPAQE